jgi:hypothetical protein
MFIEIAHAVVAINATLKKIVDIEDIGYDKGNVNQKK